MLINFVNIAKAGLVVPAAASSLWLVDPVSTFFSAKDPTQSSEMTLAVVDRPVALEDSEWGGDPTTESARIDSSRARIERILDELNRVAEVSLQMQPERASQLEPVIFDLAEQAMALSGSDVAVKASTNSELNRIEKTVGRLYHAVENAVEPEVSL